MALLAEQTSYRPTVIDGGRHRNRYRQRRGFGRGMASERWRIMSVSDGLIEWRQAGAWHQAGPGEWGLIPPNSESERMMISVGARWSDLRFSAMPSVEHDPDATALWGVTLPAVLSSDRTRALQVTLDDVIAWWWRDPWCRVRADARLAGLLISLVDGFRPAGSFPPIGHEALAPADRILAARPLASIPELAEACGLSERQFRRVFASARLVTPAAWARRLMAAQACDLLRDQPDYTVEQIGRRLGYRHAPTFIRAFAAEMGVPPATWRRQR